MSGTKHPREDLLADLAADVLPVDLAARVEAHVVGCTACSASLAEAETIRGLLRRDDPGPMPDDVAARIEAAIAELRFEDVLPADRARSFDVDAPDTGWAERRARPDEDDVEVERRWSAATRAAAEEAARTQAAARASRSRQVGIERTAGRDPDRVVPLSRLRHPVRSTVGARRQALEERRSDARADRVGRLGRPLLAAAAVLVAVGVGGVALRSAGVFPAGGGMTQSAGSADSADSGDSNASAPEAATGGGADDVKQYSVPVLAQILSTGTDYSSAGLAQQTRQLVAATVADAAAQRSGEGGAPVPNASPAPQRAAAPPGNASLSTPEALRDCLAELGVGNRQPVAVDLARYQGRDAAVLVLPVATGGYEVWVVARDCRRGADGTLFYATVAP